MRLRRGLALVAFALAASLAGPVAPARAATPTPADCTIFVQNGYAYGTPGDDIICGTPGRDIILGYGGSDTIFGFGGNDYIDAGAGNDWIDGGDGNDQLMGGTGNDYIAGGNGADRLFGGAGLDDLIGAAGNDYLNGGVGSDIVNGGAGVDLCAKDKLDRLTSCYYDTAGPRLIAVAVDKPTINTSAGPATVHVRLHIVDAGAGLARFHINFDGMKGNVVIAGISSPWVQVFQTGCPGTGPYSSDAMCPISGTTTNGIYDVALTLPHWSPARKYVLSAVEMFDAAGNRSIIGPDTLATKHMAVAFSQVAVGDGTAPGLREVAVSPSTVDTSKSSQILTLAAHVVDAVSGTAGIRIELGRFVPLNGNTDFQFPFMSASINTASMDACVNGHAPVPTDTSGSTSCRVSGTDKDGHYEFKIYLPRYLAKGRYEADAVTTTDWAGNENTLVYDQLDLTSRTMHFMQTGAGDMTAPVVTKVEVLDPAVNSGAADALVRLRVSATDALSGLAWLSVDVAATTANQTQSAYISSMTCTDPLYSLTSGVGCLESGTPQNGVWIVPIVIPAHAASGRWSATKIEVSDAIGNLRDYLPPAPLVTNVKFTNG